MISEAQVQDFAKPVDFDVAAFDIGAPRTGTTWLYQCLLEHPEVCVSWPKEVNFFSAGTPFMGPRPPTRNYQWYASCFSHRKIAQKLIDISPSYIYSANPKEMQQAFPKAKIIVHLRNPIHALQSLYQLLTKEGIFHGDFKQFIHKEGVLEIYEYGKHLQRYLTVFPRDRVHVIRYSQLQENPQKIFKDVCTFLGIRDVIPSAVSRTINANSAHWSKFIGSTFAKKCIRIAHSKPMRIFYPLIVRLESVSHALLGSKAKHADIQLDDATRMYLENYFLVSNRTTMELLQIDRID